MEPFELLKASEDGIYLLSAISSLLFALVIYSLLRNARILQAKQWATPFADTFLVLGVLYLLILANYLRFPPPHKALPTDPINIFIFLCSGITNYLFLLSALLLSAPAMNQERMLRIKRWLVGRPYVRSPLLWILCAIALAGVAGEPAAIPDALVSVMVLLLMGIALYENRVRTDKAMAWLALVSSISYAALYVLTVPVVFDYFIGRLLPGDVGVNIKNVKEPLTSLILLVLKFGFFFSGYSLMLSISGPLQGIERLLENVLHKEKEYLESDGIVRSILEELGLRRVGLYIKLPGSKENQIALYDYPSSNKGNKQEPRIFPYRAGEIYDHVMTSGTAHREHRESSFHWLFPATYKIGVPVFFHDSVIACLEAEVGKKTFTEGNRINLERLANLISPAVQTYREMSALNKLSQDLAQLQIGVVEYNLHKDFEQITKSIHDVTSPTTVGISIEIGFWEYHATYPHGEPLEVQVKKLLCTEPRAEDVLSPDGFCRWLSKGLMIPQVSATGQKTGEQVFGNFVLGLEQKKKRTEHPTIGTNPTCRRALSDLLTDTLLDFIRGHLNQLTDRLGVRLSGLKGTTVGAWLDEVERTAQEARLLWAVATGANDDDDLFGREETVALVKRLELPKAKERWVMKEDDLWLCNLDQPERDTHHVIKKVLKSSKATLWLGVAREGFDQELDYESPWKYFLNHFCEIADSALFSIQNKKRQVLIYSTVIDKHQFINLARSLTTPFTALENALKQGRLQCNEKHQSLILSYKSTVDQIENLLNISTNVAEHDERQPCSFEEVLNSVLEVANGHLSQHGIALEKSDIPETSINVPFYIAANTLSIVIDNARDAISYGNVEKGVIEIEVDDTDNDALICNIIDNGPGVPPDIVKRLLREPCKSDKPSSNGLGLFSAVNLLRAFDGDIIHVNPRPVPKTVFRIRFPK
jgi:histidine kinase/DNA gyrase B/HSP90-like ATPase